MPTRRKMFSGLEDKLHEAASSQVGFEDFGDPDYRDAMRALLHAFDTDLDISESGYEFIYNFYFLGPLIARLYAERDGRSILKLCRFRSDSR